MKNLKEFWLNNWTLVADVVMILLLAFVFYKLLSK